MMDVFLCGALADPALMRTVLGDVEVQAAQLVGARAVAVAGGDLTGVVPAEGATVGGIRLTGLTGDQTAQLTGYLAVYGLSLGPMGACRAVLGQDGPVWNASAWTGERQVAVLQAALEIMAHLPRLGPEALAQRLTSIQGRAAVWARSRAAPPRPEHDPDHDIDRDVIVSAIHRPYLNFFAMEEMDLQFRKQDGTFSEVANRGALRMSEAAAVLPYDPVRDEVLLIQQFRAPLYMGGSRSPWVWEPIAGLVDPGETPEEAAHREAMEEAGVTLGRLVAIGPTHGSPGSLADRLHLFVGIADLGNVAGATGLDSEGEDIRSEILPWETFLARLDAQAYPVLPLMALGLWLARHRDHVRRTVS